MKNKDTYLKRIEYLSENPMPENENFKILIAGLAFILFCVIIQQLF